MTPFEQQVADAMEDILEHEAAKKEASSTLREYFRGELASRVAEAIQVAILAAWDDDVPEKRALAALRGEPQPEDRRPA